MRDSRLYIRIFRLASISIVALILVSSSILLARAEDAGWALQFDGSNDLVKLPSAPTIIGAGWENSKSVSLWVKPTGTAQDCESDDVALCDTIFGDKPRYWGITRGLSLGLDRIWVWNYDASETSSTDSIGLTYTPGEWVYVTLVHDSGDLCAYKNSVLAGCVESGATQQSESGSIGLYLGGMINDVTRNTTFEGEIDEVSIWNRALSPAEIAANMYASLVGDESGLMAYYRMSDGSGDTLTDDSQYDWNGVLLDGDVDVPPDGEPAVWVPSGAFDGSTATPTASNTPLTPSPTKTDTPQTPTPTESPTPTNHPPTPTLTGTSTRTATSSRTPNPAIQPKIWLPLLERG
jgi:hypothetical protein